MSAAKGTSLAGSSLMQNIATTALFKGVGVCSTTGLGAVAFNPGVINTDMLLSTFGNEAKEYENPNEWAMHAVSRLEALTPSDSGNTVIG